MPLPALFDAGNNGLFTESPLAPLPALFDAGNNGLFTESPLASLPALFDADNNGLFTENPLRLFDCGTLGAFPKELGLLEFPLLFAPPFLGILIIYQ